MIWIRNLQGSAFFDPQWAMRTSSGRRLRVVPQESDEEYLLGEPIDHLFRINQAPLDSIEDSIIHCESYLKRNARFR